MKIKLVLIDSSKGEADKTLKYYVDTSKVRHMDHWRYSPVFCGKVIETVFSDGEL